VLDFSAFFQIAEKSGDPAWTPVHQRFSASAASFPTKLSTETVGDFEIPLKS
jgi:hypothetical protein